MELKIKFMYRRKAWSFLNKTFTIIATAALIIILVYNFTTHQLDTAMKYIGLWGLVYAGFAANTLQYIWMERRYLKQGTKCSGTIVQSHDVKLYSYPNSLRKEKEKAISWVSFYAIVSYIDPRTQEKKEFRTPSVTGNPFHYLNSPYVTVYVLPNGKAWATDFDAMYK